MSYYAESRNVHAVPYSNRNAVCFSAKQKLKNTAKHRANTVKPRVPKKEINVKKKHITNVLNYYSDMHNAHFLIRPNHHHRHYHLRQRKTTLAHQCDGLSAG